MAIALERQESALPDFCQLDLLADPGKQAHTSSIAPSVVIDLSRCRANAGRADPKPERGSIEENQSLVPRGVIYLTSITTQGAYAMPAKVKII